ncbi:hypothetical protein TTHERM_00344360 (macronuclear) [Tetrahymena thermophila SB210]|uniref:Uncharacterized protein n=1 Tax=Tetrahymena thermophila (strain SB210) TaxID=312017 RepID=I7MKD8_TETTS|nr:hypothetical protein TTHERM_00344360 [Tetrahymena thermophila SB210]EAR98236.2 hypothetical protein TTHERM_00344360 [Tetrahymena thermophila SB210]|eukprot:XP_001018481.2 hypothetical protein TTHERM_00344360 [Tetrahymena thermophila SB210]
MSGKLLYLISYVQALSKCQCTVDSSPIPGLSSTPPPTLSISRDNEEIDNVDQGKLIAIGSIQVLQKLFSVQQQSSAGLNQNCPSGYIPVTQDDLTSIIARSDFQFLVGSTYLNLDFSKNTYYSSTKVNPTVTSGSDANAYVYYTLSLDEKSKPVIGQENTYFDKKTKATICKRNLKQFSISLAGYEGFDLEKGKSYQMQITNKNVLQYYIYDNNGNKFTTQTFSYTHNGDSQWGCATLNFKLQLFGGISVGDCLAIWTQNQIAFNADSSSFNMNSIQTSVLQGVKANVNNGFFFSSGSAPIAPIIGDSSSFYVYYSIQTTNQLMVQKVSSTGTPIGPAIDTKQVGDTFDIVSTGFGFVVMAADSTQRAFIQAINKDGSQRWLRILINNGDKPNSPKDQIKFFSDDKCSLPFGMTCMYRPHNGRLNYARGKIQAIWAHYNHFGFKNGARDDHTADSMISLDADTGYDQNIFWAWGASHSLYQNMHYDGKNLYVASLGDAFPMNIKFQVCNIDTFQCKASSTVVQGDIPGDGSGKASGRIGGFFSIYGNRNQKLFVYQRKACNGGYAGKTSTNSINELAVIKFDSQLNYISSTTLLSGDIASRVNSIKSLAYGKNILLAYTVIPNSELQNFNRQNSNPKVDQAFIALLNGVDGSFLVQPQQLSSYQINSSDDWRILENGSIAYTYIDINKNLNVYYTPSLIIPSYPHPILTTDTTYGFGSFTNSQVSIPINNYNNVCLKQGDSNWSIVDFGGNSSNNNSNSKTNKDEITNNDSSNNNSNSKTNKDEITNKDSSEQNSFKQIIKNLWIILILLTINL